jgi:adenylate kinase family enzyme
MDIVRRYLQQGDLLPTELILQILRGKIEIENKKGHHRFLIDGFPRQVEQGLEFEKEVKS